MNASPNAVEVEKLTVKFGDFTAVDDISFWVKKGEIFGFLGANGAGKTTTIRVLCGLLTPTTGRVRVEGLDPHEGLTPIKEKVGYMSQKFTLYQDLKVGENLAFAASLRKIPDDVFQRRVQELFEFIGFDRGKDIMVRDLPGGTRQEISLVAALLHDPDIVFLDEPTSGVTPASRARFWDLIRQITGRGKTVFVTTHYMQEAEQCGRIALMRDGRIVALDTPTGLKEASFPESLYELTPLPGGGTGWVEELGKSRAVVSLKPYGLRYHAVVKSEKGWLEETKRHLGKFEAKRIPPSLEDVFIRVVEGGGP